MLDPVQFSNDYPNIPATRAARRPSRYALVDRFRVGRDVYVQSVLAQRLEGSTLNIGRALEAVRSGCGPETELIDLRAELEHLGLRVKPSSSEAESEGAGRVVFDPAMLRRAFNRLPNRLVPRFVFHVSLGDAQLEPLDYLDRVRPSRYSCGVSEQDEARMQIEVLRQELLGFDICVSDALDELCGGLARPLDGDTPERLNRIALALESVGLNFHAAMKSWRLPRLGVLLIEDPWALRRAYPELAFFEPEQFTRTLIVDRLERGGRELSQGLLF